jgi:hypothetical protein
MTAFPLEAIRVNQITWLQIVGFFADSFGSNLADQRS